MKFSFCKKNKRIALITILIIIFLAVPTFTVFSQSEKAPEVLTFSMVLEEKDTISDFILAVEEYEKSILEQELYSLSGDPEFGISPAVKSQWNNLTDPLQTDLNMIMDVTLYTGRNPVLEEKYQAAVRNVQASRLEMESALNETVFNLYNLYSTTWLLQQESTILEKEEQLAVNKYSGAYEKYTEGDLNLNELEDAEDELQTAEAAVLENFLAIRLAWFSFQQYRGKSENLLNPDIPVLEEFRFEIDDVQKPAVLSEQVLIADSSVMKLQNALTSLNETAERLRNLDISLTFKPYMQYEDYSANLTYVPDNRQLNLSSSIPIASFNSSETQDNQKKWNAGMSLVFEIDTGNQNRIEKDILEKEIIQQEILLNRQIDRTVYELRSAYQQFVQARQSLELSETAYNRQVRLEKAVEIRLESGQALKSDLLSAEIAVQRSQWKLSSARTIMQKAYMLLIVLTGELPF